VAVYEVFITADRTWPVAGPSSSHVTVQQQQQQQRPLSAIIKTASAHHRIIKQPSSTCAPIRDGTAITLSTTSYRAGRFSKSVPITGAAL